jgi:hypothetical protein
VASSSKPPAFFLHNVFSAIVGIVTVRLAHAHALAPLAATVGLWALSMVFISVRARGNDGKFLEMEVFWYNGLSVSFFVVGLLCTACAYTIFA